MKIKMLKLVALSLTFFGAVGCANNTGGDLKVTFDTNTTLETSAVSTQYVQKGSKIKEPSSTILGENPDGLALYGWYTSKSFETRWNFKKDTVEKNMTLFAKWERQFTVQYFVSGSTYPTNTATVFNGDIVKEHPEYCVGFEYEGSFLDDAFSIPFDYSTPITKDTNIYMKKSETIDIYEGNKAGSLFDNLDMYGPTDGSGEAGFISKTEDKSAVIIDFGYSPKLADPYAELNLNLDITKSPVIHFVIKNYGAATQLGFYYTTLIDPINYEYSATGKQYSATFHYNYFYKAGEMNMSPEDEYIDVAVDFAENSKFQGYSVWGTSKCLGRMRIQSSYQSKDPTDRTNRIELKRIYGSNSEYPGGVSYGDSAVIKAQLKDQDNLPSQDSLERGFIFPKDSNLIVNGETTHSYNRKNGTLIHFTNEVEMRRKEDKVQTFAITLPTNDDGDVIGDKQINLEENKVLKIKLKNLGYAESLHLGVTNDYSGTSYADLKIPSKMSDFKTFTVNLSNELPMKHTLLSIFFEYTACGMDNVIIFDSVYFEEAKPYDIAGISFDDKNCFGMSCSGVQVSHLQNYFATQFVVSNDNATVTSTKSDIHLCNKGFYKAELTYSKPNNSEISAVYVSFFNGSSYGEELMFSVGNENSAAIQVDMNPTTTGIITNVKFRFAGTGTIRISSLKFLIDDTYCLNLANDFSKSFDPTWLSGITYESDDVTSSSTFGVDQSISVSQRRISFYLCEGYNHRGAFPAYNCTNWPCSGKTKFIINYHNSGETATSDIVVSFSASIDINPDGQNKEKVYYSTTFRGNMAEYEWDYVELLIPTEWAELYIGKLSIRGLTSPISVRTMCII